eukprot:g81462.t1
MVVDTGSPAGRSGIKGRRFWGIFRIFFLSTIYLERLQRAALYTAKSGAVSSSYISHFPARSAWPRLGDLVGKGYSVLLHLQPKVRTSALAIYHISLPGALGPGLGTWVKNWYLSEINFSVTQAP